MAEIARDLNCLTIAVVTKPFAFEGKQRMKNAEMGVIDLKQRVDTLVVIPNDRLLQVVTKGTSMLEAFPHRRRRAAPGHPGASAT